MFPKKEIIVYLLWNCQVACYMFQKPQPANMVVAHNCTHFSTDAPIKVVCVLFLDWLICHHIFP